MGWWSNTLARLGMRRAAPALPPVTTDGVGADSAGTARYAYHDGEKFPGGFGATNLLITDYWTLRARSAELFERNLYARGVVRRLATNVINTGLHLEATPVEKELGYPDDGLAEWSEDTERHFETWGKTPKLCDHAERQTFGSLQAALYQEALVVGDVLVVLMQEPRTRLPRVRLVSGSAVQTPFPLPKTLRKGHKIVHGVELDPAGRHVAYWIRKERSDRRGFDSERLLAYGPKTKRRIAWLVYGTDKRLDAVRGQPILSLMMQAVAELDRFRDATLRKALMQAFISIFISKTEDKPGSRPLTGAAVKKSAITQTDSSGTRSWKAAEMIPGIMIDELQTGEEPKAFQTQATSEGFGDFERAIVATIAWSNDVPPEILTLAFSNNYSASQAAINEFKMFLNVVRTRFGAEFCQGVYEEWLISQVLAQRIEAPGLLDSWRGNTDFRAMAAWVDADWAGAIKPAVDASKLVKGYAEMVAQGFITRARATRELTGMKHSQVVRLLARENEALAAANAPMNPAPAPAEPEQGDDSGAGDPDREDDEDRAEAVIRVVKGGQKG